MLTYFSSIHCMKSMCKILHSALCVLVCVCVVILIFCGTNKINMGFVYSITCWCFVRLFVFSTPRFEGLFVIDDHSW